LIERFLKNIQQSELITPGQHIILAVSGGMDSVAMAHLFYHSGYPFAIAHCNFKLRGSDSDADALFVEQLAVKMNVPFFSKSFDTRSYGESRNISIQMAARELRYQWFGELRKLKGYDYVATAHHKDDQAETVLINIARGTGMRGLKGIPVKENGLIRPLLGFHRNEIEAFVDEQKIAYREDLSNKEEKYTRNKIRHQVIPVFKEINSAFTDHVEELSRIASGTQKLFSMLVQQTFDPYIVREKDSVKIPLDVLSGYPSPDVLLFELLREFGFQPSVIADIAEALEGQPGKIFYSSSHSCLKDRNYLVVAPRKKPESNEYAVSNSQDEVVLPGARFIFKSHPAIPLSQIPSNPDSAFVDSDKIRFPLRIRHPRDGDFFTPLGMSGKKKLSDFFIDEKVLRTDKASKWIVLSGEKIVWVVGMRIDERFRVTSTTKNVLEIKFLR